VNLLSQSDNFFFKNKKVKERTFKVGTEIYYSTKEKGERKLMGQTLSSVRLTRRRQKPCICPVFV
jgi:hypothetical protein